ncbi:hypothetical protein BPAE_0223g00070 [Botrytis paeoniae]|uniref:Uncharacterized protein n=1 Tax=Botrytis paeoniae TaxID=278948 RepID=A0A4Z1FDI9_9HELO|nr:hypothetical protein BPAE_0223g00070 [Botrytis paeoniae]
MPFSSRRSTARAHNSHGTSNSLREYNSRPNPANHSHIQTIPAESVHENLGSENEIKSPDFIIKGSAQEEIEDQLEYEKRLQSLRTDYPANSTITIPISLDTTYADIMAARPSRSRRRNEALDEGQDMKLGGPMTLESLGPFKYTFRKKKNLKTKYSASTINDDQATDADNGGAGLNDDGIITNEGVNTDLDHSETTSEVGIDPELVGSASSSRPISPTSTPQFKPSLDDPPPHHTTLQKQRNYLEFTFSATAPKRIIEYLEKNTKITEEELKDSDDTLRENDLEDDDNTEDINNNIVQPIVTAEATTATSTTITVTTTDISSIDPIPSTVVIQPPPGVFRVSSFSYSSTDKSRTQTLCTIDSGIGLNSPSLDLLKSDNSDTQSVKDKSDAVMARIASSTGLMVRSLSDITTVNDGFDSVEWDPDLPVRSINNSPEPLSVEVQPVAYTTVGSRVNPNLQPQISAPNRIQREGSIRRPQLDPTHNRQPNYYSHTRGPPPPLNMQNSMHYAQQLGQAPNSFNTPPATSARSTRSLRASQRLSQSEQENHTLLRLQGMINARVSNVHYPVSPNTPTPASHQNNLSSISNEEELAKGTDLQGPISGLEKMQTLQRLAKFPNPMQTSALRRLSELQAPKAENTANSNGDIEVARQRLEYLLRNPRDNTMLDDAQAAKNGELDRTYTFPPPGISDTAYNPLYNAYPRSNNHSRDSANHRGVPGYPQPLTAGPPGQRSYANNRQNSTHSEEAWTQDQVGAKQNSHTSTEPISPWQESKVLNEQYSAQAPAQAPSARATDTISMQQARQYYPHGFPSDMTGRFTRLSINVQKEMGLLEDEETPEEARARKQTEKDEWFYSGQKRWNMRVQEHIAEIEIHTNPFGPIGPPTKKNLPSDNRPLPGITISRIEKKTISEVIAPLIDGTLGNLFAIKAQQEDGNFTSPFIRYAKSPEWHIDTSARGNDSFFEESWGVSIDTPAPHNDRVQR